MLEFGSFLHLCAIEVVSAAVGGAKTPIFYFAIRRRLGSRAVWIQYLLLEWQRGDVACCSSFVSKLFPRSNATWKCDIWTLVRTEIIRFLQDGQKLPKKNGNIFRISKNSIWVSKVSQWTPTNLNWHQTIVALASKNHISAVGTFQIVLFLHRYCLCVRTFVFEFSIIIVSVFYLVSRVATHRWWKVGV